MRRGIAVLLACSAVTGAGAEMLSEATFTPTAVTVEKAALAALTAPSPSASSPTPVVSASFEGGALDNGTKVSGSLGFGVGPSFTVSGIAVVTWLDDVSGDLSVERGGSERRWHVEQFNFLNQAARANYDRARSSLSVFMPSVLTADGQPAVHAFLVLKGTVEKDRIVWRSLMFTFDEMVARAFPGSPGIETVIGPRPAAVPPTPR